MTVDGTSLKIGPSLIGKRQHITFTLLVDGTRPCLTCQSPLIDVQVRRLRPEDLRPVAAILPVVAISAILPAAAIAALFELAAASRERATAALALLQARASEVAAALEEAGANTGVAGRGPTVGALQAEARTAAHLQASATRAATIDDWIAIALAAVAVAAIGIVVIMLYRRWARRSRQ